MSTRFPPGSIVYVKGDRHKKRARVVCICGARIPGGRRLDRHVMGSRYWNIDVLERAPSHPKLKEAKE